jgi:hypothetical protein
MFYDQLPTLLRTREQVEIMRNQLREFVLKYFMRVSSFRQPETYIDAGTPVPPPALTRLSWCPNPSISRIGFGFTQLFNKRAGTGAIEAFPSYASHAIVDQRTVGDIYEWLLLRVNIFNFSFSTGPLLNGIKLDADLNEASYIEVNK